jgi:hypothetical protein
VIFPMIGVQNFGFGPGWNCFNPGHGEPICIKLPNAKPTRPQVTVDH